VRLSAGFRRHALLSQRCTRTMCVVLCSANYYKTFADIGQVEEVWDFLTGPFAEAMYPNAWSVLSPVAHGDSCLVGLTLFVRESQGQRHAIRRRSTGVRVVILPHGGSGQAATGPCYEHFLQRASFSWLSSVSPRSV
jgi:hypothetical protein